MDRTLVIYDLTGRILSIIYGATEESVPQGVPSVWVDIPAGAILNHIDPATAEPVFDYLPDTDLGKFSQQLKEISDFVAGANGLITEAVSASADASASSKLAADNAVSAREAADNATAMAEGQASDITTIQEALAEVYELLLSMEEA